MKKLLMGVGMLMVLTSGPTLATEVSEGALKVCVTRADQTQAGANVRYIGAPLGTVQDGLGEDSCTTVDPTEGPYVVTVDTVSTPIKPYRGTLKACVTRADVAEAGIPVYVVVPPSTSPLTAVTDETGCASFASFNGVYVMLTTNLPIPATPPAVKH
jgi:hypothetical protein